MTKYTFINIIFYYNYIIIKKIRGEFMEDKKLEFIDWKNKKNF